MVGGRTSNLWCEIGWILILSLMKMMKVTIKFWCYFIYVLILLVWFWITCLSIKKRFFPRSQEDEMGKLFCSKVAFGSNNPCDDCDVTYILRGIPNTDHHQSSLLKSSLNDADDDVWYQWWWSIMITMTMTMMMIMECSGCIGKGGRGQVPSHSVTKHHIYNADHYNHDNHDHHGFLMMTLVIMMIRAIAWWL